ncbi:MAG: YibE/F family protein [Dactylosporangium sp.]|nr:YibE/F family protein [Dactylosporangium sp.]
MIVIPCAAITAFLVALLWPARPETPPTSSSLPRAYGDVLQITEVPCPDSVPTVGPPLPCGTAVVRVTSGPGAGTEVTVDLPHGPGAPRLSAGDSVVLGQLPQAGGGGPRFVVVDHQRGTDLLVMVGLCMIAVIAFGRWRGVTALIGLGVSFAFLLLFIIPAILNGQAPLPVAIVGSAAIMFAVLYLTHGLSVTTSVAVLGTLASLVITGLLGALFTVTTSLTGFGDEESIYLSIHNNQIDLRGLLLAGIIIGALGVLDDVTVTQATTVAELAPTATSRLALFRSAIRVGRAHVGSAVNTIVLAYAGASLPVLLLIAAGGQAVSDVLTSPFLAQEIVRAAVGTIGLVAAVPITTGLATLVADLGRAAGGRAADGRAAEARSAAPEPRRDRADGTDPRPRWEPERSRSR